MTTLAKQIQTDIDRIITFRQLKEIALEYCQDIEEDGYNSFIEFADGSKLGIDITGYVFSK